MVSRVGTATNLPVGGTYDLLMIKFPDGYPEGKLIFNIDDTPRAITGIQKVAQTFIKVLFTSRGSDVLLPNQGTDFSNLVMNANVQLTDTLFHTTLRDQINSASAQVKYNLNAGADTASQLDTVDIIGLDGIKDAVTIYLQLTTMAGTSAQVAIPFPQLSLAMSPTA